MNVTQQEYKTLAVRSSAVLTNSYVAGTVIGAASIDSNNVKLNDQPHEWNHLTLLVNFTLGSLTDARIKVEISPDNVTYYQTIIGTVSGNVNTVGLMEFLLNADGKYALSINSENLTGFGLKARYIKVSAKGTGTVTNSLMDITAIVGVS